MRRSILALCIVSFSASLMGQKVQTVSDGTARPQRQEPITSLRTTTRLVFVDVVVRDKDGKPVHGLKAEEFALSENGTSQTFKGFEEHVAPPVEQLAKEAAKTPASIKLPQGTFSNFAAARFDGPLNILLLDRLNTPKADQLQMKNQINEFLDHAPPGQRMAVFGLTDQLVMLQGFTGDVATLRRAVSTENGLTDSPLLSSPISSFFANGPGNSASGSGTSVSMGGDEADSARGPTSSMSPSEQMQAANQLDLRRTVTLHAMNGLARYLAALPGRKNVVWFSGSFPVVMMLATGIPGVKYSAEREFQETTALLSRSQVAMYPIDVKGLNQSSIFSAADNGCNGCSATSHVAGGIAIRGAMNDFAENNYDEHSTMYQLGDDTGGKAFINTNDFTDAMAKALNDGANYYTIAYTPSNPDLDGGYRRIQVKLKERGYEISYRRGYFAQKLEGVDDPGSLSGSRSMQIALTHGAPEPTQLLFQARVQPVSATTEAEAAPRNKPSKGVTGPYRRYAVDFAINPREIHFAQSIDGNRHETLEFITYVFDEAGQLVNSVGNSIKTTVTPAEYAQFQQSGVPFHQEISVPAKGQFSFRIAMHDVEANLVGAVELSGSSVSGLQPLTASTKGAGR